jgi:hypothetical protein
MSTPLSLVSAIVWVALVALVALPGSRSAHAGDVESWVQHPAIHATVSLGLPAAHRAPPSASSHRRAAPAFGAPLAADTYVRPLREITVSRAEPSADPSVRAQVIARGYDATAPPVA